MGRRKLYAVVDEDARPGWTKCLRCVRAFRSPDRRRVRFCPRCRRVVDDIQRNTCPIAAMPHQVHLAVPAVGEGRDE